MAGNVRVRRTSVDNLSLWADTSVQSSAPLTLVPIDVTDRAKTGLANDRNDRNDRAPSIGSRSFTSTPSARDNLHERYSARITHNPALDRTLVSFQANKNAPFSGWFKYREGFSEALVTYLLQTLAPQPGIVLDPFAGAGTTLFAARSQGWRAEGIELLPVGVYAMQARLAAQSITPTMFADAIAQLRQVAFEDHYDHTQALKHIAITQGSFPQEEERALIGYLAYCQQLFTDDALRSSLIFAAFCILEDISYTRKDGQYLRWDARAGRRRGAKPFNKGRIPTFREAVFSKLKQMQDDIEQSHLQPRLFESALATSVSQAPVHFAQGSCLELLPTRPDASVDVILTSPPYANRYDYTRTYALELVFLGADDETVKRLRQTMLSCTVENRDKRAQLRQFYTAMGREAIFQRAETAFNEQMALQETLSALEAARREGRLNNDHVVRMVHNYFYEMCFVIYEMARLLKPGGLIAMVNDNVRYAGEEVPVDLILSAFAEAFGLRVRHIWTLGRGKGNSSQQMGIHGRAELRKCVYVWEKAE